MVENKYLIYKLIKATKMYILRNIFIMTILLSLKFSEISEDKRKRFKKNFNLVFFLY
jgi:hypothetical protein